MNINYKNTIDDLLTLNIYEFENDKIAQRKVKFIQIGIPIVMLGLFLFLTNKSRINMPFFIGFFIFWGLFSVLYPNIIIFQYKKVLIRKFSSKVSNNEDYVIMLTLDEDGLVNKEKYSTLKLAWAGVYKVEVIDTHIFIFLDELKAIIIPNDTFKNDKEKNEFLEIIYKHVDKNKIKIDI